MGDESAVPINRATAGSELTGSSTGIAASAIAISLDGSTEDTHYLFRLILRLTDCLSLIAIIAIVYCFAWEYSTQRYVDAFSDAIVPVAGTSEQKIQSILDWMTHPPARFISGITGAPNDRDPIDTLNYKALLQVCGTATNAFINLADTSDLRSRRLLLLGADGGTRHVDAEVWINGRWFVVDPTFRVILRGPHGEMLTERELANPSVFAAATRTIPRYDPSYNFEHTAHIRIAKIPFIGKRAGQVLDSIAPHWQDSAEISLLAERDSLLALTVALIVALLLFLLCFSAHWYGKNRLKIPSSGLIGRFRSAVRGFVSPVGNAT